MRKLFLALPLLIAAPVLAQMTMPKEAPGKADVKLVTAGTYKVETSHTLVEWSVNHFGFNNYFGLFGGATGEMTLDPANPTATKLNISIPISGLTTTNAELTKNLLAPSFFDVAKFPTASFVSTMIMPDSNGNAQIMGNFTLHGITKPVTLNATFIGAGKNSFSGKDTVGFQATSTIKRSEYGMAGFIPLVSDAIDLKITVAFEKAPSVVAAVKTAM